MKAILQTASLLGLALALCLVSWGCASVSAGNRVNPDSVSFITPGITTKQEVLENLGPPLFDLEGGRLVAYYWQTTASYQTGGIYLFGQTLREPSGPKLKGFAFCVAFDAGGRVTRSATTSTENDETLSNAVLKWHSQTK